MSDMGHSEAIVGYVLAKSYKTGLKVISIRFSEIDSELGGVDLHLLINVVNWMAKEGLVSTSVDYNDGLVYQHFMHQKRVEGIQLTSKGIKLLKQPDSIDVLQKVMPTDVDSELPAPEKQVEVSISNFTKLGAMIGGILGGATKSLS